ncbi:hypothetical protein MPSEU_000890700 [Mayamaea pseudoterrestris]|nr:hypothetical protein MPSEU_000890700 [Mayamaea pseudoterrestris]
MDPSERVIHWLHRIPRFGHSNNLALLAADSEALQQDYVDGIMSFSILIAFVALTWTIALLVFKFFYGRDRVGCAAGGQPINISSLRKKKLSRSSRRSILVRNWRTQAVFLVCSLGLTTLSFVFINHGIDPFTKSLDVVNDAAMAIDATAFEAMQLARTVEQLRDSLVDWAASVNITNSCPDFATSPLAQNVPFERSTEIIIGGARYVNNFVDKHADGFVSSVGRTTRASAFVEEKIEMAKSNEHLVDGVLIAFNVINAILFFGVLLVKSNIHLPYYQRACSYLIVPTFCALLAGLLAVTCISSTIGVLNADFCSGGQAASAQGTMLDLLSVKGLNSSHLSYKALNYYTDECSGVNPLGAIGHSLGQRVANMTNEVQVLQSAMNLYELDDINSACGGDLGSYNETIGKMHASLKILGLTATSTENLTSCANIEPIFQSVVRGPACSESVEGLSCLLGTSCGMLILGLVMLSTRAALYNPIIRPRRRKRREREFKEYVEYMGAFYDTAEWKLDVFNSKQKATISPAPTFETTGSDESSPARPFGSNFVNAKDDSFDGAEDEAVSSESPAFPSISVSTPPSSQHVSYSTSMPDAQSLHTDESEDPDVEFYSSDSEDDESIGTKTNISALVSRFFVVQRGSDQDSTFSTNGELNASSLSLMSLLGPVSNLFTPKRKKKSVEGNKAFDETLNRSTDLFLDIGHSTPVASTVRPNEKQYLKPQKRQRSLLRTHGGANMPAPRTDVV